MPNRPPVVTGEVADTELPVGQSLTLDVSEYFSEPDGQALVYVADPGAADVVEATMTGPSLTIAALAKGTAPVTVTATDPGGLTATVGFSVKVPNRGPVPEGTMEARTMEVGKAEAVDVSPFFSDPDGDELAYGVETSDAALLAVEVSGNLVEVTAVAKGPATVTVTATDTEGASATQSFEVTVPNQVPLAVGEIPVQTVEVGHEVSVEMAAYFMDPDGDVLEYQVVTDNAAVAEVSAGELVLTVSALAKGSATMTVTATDTEGAAATQTFAVTVPNRAPVVTEALPARTEIEVGEAATVDMSSFFSDPDGDDLAYAVVTGDVALAVAEVSGSVIMVTAVAKGSVIVKVTATDPEGGATAQSFDVAVPNRAPVAKGAVEAQTTEVGEAATVDMSPFFSDPDGDALAYTVETSDAALATAEVSGSVVSVTAIARGSASVKVTATDTEGASATQDFEVTVPNRVPVAVGEIPAQTVEVGHEVALEMGPFFTDPDGDALVYAVAPDNTTVAKGSAGELAVMVAALAKGNATMTVTATDIEGASATQSFSVMVPNRPPAITGEIPTQTVEVGEERTMDLSSYFTDPDGDPLAHAVEVTDAAVVTASVAEGAVVLAALAKGEATVTVTVTDDEGLTAMQAFPVTVPNRAPVTEGAVEPQTIEVGETAAVDASSHFSDPDGDELSYTFTIPDVAVATIEPTGHLAVLTAKAKGTATATVTATDAEGLTATMAFAVTVPNQAPVAMGSIAAQTVYRDSVIEVEVASAFTDPDGDALVYTVASFNPAVVEATATDGVVTVSTISQGEATVTVQATDGEGLADSAGFLVTVPNRGPLVPGRFSRYRLEPDDTLTLGTAQYFADPDGDPLDVEAESSDERVATAAIENESLVLVAVRRGAAKVTVTATDPWGLEVEQEFRVSVVRPGDGGGGNKPPTVTGTISPRTVTSGEQFRMGIDGYFHDPDGDALAFFASSADEDNAVAEVTGSTLTVTGAGAGKPVDVTVTAVDPGSLIGESDPSG